MKATTAGSIFLATLLAMLCLVHEQASAQAGAGRPFVLVRHLVSFGSVPLDSCRTDTISIVRRDTGRAMITGVTYNPKTAEFTAEGLNPKDTISGRKVFTFIYCPDDTVADEVIAIVTFRGMGGEAWMDTVRLMGRGRVAGIRQPTVRFDSGSLQNVESLYCGTIRLGDSSVMPIEVVNTGSVIAIGQFILGNGSGPFRIESVRRQGVGWGPPRGIDTIPVQGSLGLRVRYTPTRLGLDTATLFFVSSGNVIRSAIMVGNGTGGVIGVPTQLDYGLLRLDTCIRISVPISNSGPAPLEITRFDFDTSVLTLDNTPRLPDTIQPGTSHTYELRLCLRDTGRYTGTITVASNAVSGAGRIGISAFGIAGALAAAPVPPRRVTGDCDTIEVVVRNVGTASTRASVLRLSGGDRGFLFVDSGAITKVLGVQDTLRIRIRFCPTSLADASDTIVVSDQAGNLLMIPLRGKALRARMVPLRLLSDGVPLKICDFRDVPVGTSRSVTVYLRNTGNLRFAIERSGLAAAVAPGSSGGSFSVAPARSDAARIEIGPDGIDSITVTYRSSSPGSDSGLVTVAGTAPIDGNLPQSVGTAFSVTGNGVLGAVDNRKIWITSGGDSVGKTIRLAVVVDPPIRAEERLTRLELRFNVDGRSLVPVDEGDPEVVMEKRAGYWSVTRSGSVLTGDTIAHIALVGLSTGMQINRLALLPEPRIEGLPVARLADTSLVFLEGCGLGRTPGFRIKSQLNGIVIPSSADVAAITYRVPAGIVPQLRLIDVDGATRLTIELEPGTDGDQTASIPLKGIGAGVYLVELRLDGDRSVIPIMIAR